MNYAILKREAFSAQEGMRWPQQCPRGDTHLTHMINIVLTKEFTLDAAGAR
jgi:hypothetical protein